jgi:uncharacterized protein YbjT (DUF2867 family)
MKVSQEPSAPLVAVVGANGIQGGSVINALIESDKPYHLHGLTRDTSKPAARKLIGQGVEKVGVTIGTDNAEKVHQAFEGASIVFVSASILRFFTSYLNLFQAMTNFWDHTDKQRASRRTWHILMTCRLLIYYRKSTMGS